jgi:PAS domain S-box-containing protein
VAETILDITERKQVEEALRRSEARFRFFMDNSPAIAFIKDAEGRYIYVNKRTDAIYGPDALIGKTDRDALPAAVADALRFNDRAVLRANAPDQFIEQVPTPDGVVHDWLVLKFPIEDGVGGRHLAGMAFDITAQVRARAALEQANADLERSNRSLEDQVRARTATLLQYQELLRSLASELALGEERQRKQLATDLHDTLAQTLTVSKIRLAAMQRSGKVDVDGPAFREVQTLVSEALQFTRSLMSELRPMLFGGEHDLATAMEWVIDRMRRHGLEVVLRDDGTLKMLDEDVLTVTYRAVLELLYNVVKHAGTPRATVTLRRGEDRRLVAEVTDAGCGFSSPDARSETCGKFGLLNIRERVRSVGGQFEVVSAPGVGTCARILVPLRDSSAASGLPEI